MVYNMNRFRVDVAPIRIKKDHFEHGYITEDQSINRKKNVIVSCSVYEDQ